MDDKTPKIIHTFLLCRKCVERRRGTSLEIGVDESGHMVQVWCKIHDEHVGAFELAEPYLAQCEHHGHTAN